MQEIAFAIWRALPAFRGECSERTFVYRIAHNRALTHRWQRRRAWAGEAVSLDEVDGLADPAPGPEAHAGKSDAIERLQAAVRRLPIQLQQCVVLRLEGLHDAEIADVVGISEANVAVRLTRARRAIRTLLGEEGG